MFVIFFYQPMDEKIKTWTLRFPAQENPNMELALFDWPIVLQYDVKAKHRLISRKFSGMKFFHPRIRLTNRKSRALYPFDQPMKSLYSRSFVVFVYSCVFISRSYENRSIVAFRPILLSVLFTFIHGIFHFIPFAAYLRKFHSSEFHSLSISFQSFPFYLLSIFS